MGYYYSYIFDFGRELMELIYHFILYIYIPLLKNIENFHIFKIYFNIELYIY